MPETLVELISIGGKIVVSRCWPTAEFLVLHILQREVEYAPDGGSSSGTY